MFSNVFLLTTAALISSVVAQSATGSTTALIPETSSIPACILACIQPAAALNGCSLSDSACVCSSAQFRVDATACLIAHCSPTEVAEAAALENAECAKALASINPAAVTTTHSIPFSISTAAATTDTTVTLSSTTPSPTPSPSTVKTGSASSLMRVHSIASAAGAIVIQYLMF